MKTSYHIIIIGGGIIGQIMGLAAAQTGCKVAIIDSRDMNISPQDGRAFAIAASGIRMLERLGLDLSTLMQPITSILVTDGNKNSPWKLNFGDEYQSEQTASMIESIALYEQIQNLARTKNNIEFLSSHHIKAWDFKTDSSAITLGNGKTLTSTLMIAADGRNSQTRQSAGIETTKKSFGQSALVTTIEHSLPHHGLATQRFLKGGPLAVLPLRNTRSQIVWSNNSEATEAAIALADDSFIALLSEHIGPHLGDITLTAPRQSYPLINQLAEAMSSQRLALIGDAAHVIHPLAGQGLNLGLRDIAALSHEIEQARRLGQDIGVVGLRNYEDWRQTDTQLMSNFTDNLNTLYQTPSSTLAHLRKTGISLINQSQFLKSFIMDEAAGNTGELPALMKM